MIAQLVILYAVLLIIFCTLASLKLVDAKIIHDIARWMLVGQSCIIVVASLFALYSVRKYGVSGNKPLPPQVSFMMFTLFVLGACAAMVPEDAGRA